VSISATARVVWAVGTANLGTSQRHALTSRWNGIRWNGIRKRWVMVRNPAALGSSLFDVATISPRNAWAVGSAKSGAVLVLHWNGSSWSKIGGLGFGYGLVEAVTAIPGTKQVWIYGTDGTTGELTAARRVGTAWQKYPLTISAASYLISGRSIAAASTSSAWIAMSAENYAGRSRPLIVH